MTCEVCKGVTYQNKEYNPILHSRMKKLELLGFGSVVVLACSIISTLGLSLAGLVGGAIASTGMRIYSNYCAYERKNWHDNFTVFSAFVAVASFASVIPIFSATTGVISVVGGIVSYVAYRIFKGINTDYFPDEDNLLIDAIRTNRVWLAKLSLFLGADPNLMIDYEGDRVRAIQWACLNNRVSIAEILLKYHANPNFAAVDAVSPLIVAVNAGHSDIVRLLLAAGAQCNVVNGGQDLPYITAATLLSNMKKTLVPLPSSESEEKIKQEKEEPKFKTVYDKTPEFEQRKKVLEYLLTHQPELMRTSMMDLFT